MNPLQLNKSDDDLKRLALIIARNKVGPNDPIADVLNEHGEDPNAVLPLLDDPVFKRYVKEFEHELQDRGVSFKLKSRILAEDALSQLYGLVCDPEVPAVARVKAFEALAKYGGLDMALSVEEKQTLSQLNIPLTNAPTFSITFNFSQPQTAQTIEAEYEQLPN